jgi:hypothetical protein
MVLTFPLSATTFFSRIDIEAVTFIPSWGQEFSGLQGGTIIVKDRRPALWTAAVQSNPIPNDDAVAIEALINAMGGSLQSFHIWNPKRQYPRADPKGTILGASTPTILSLNVDNRRLALTGLPPGYVLSVGDFLAFTYSTTRRALHQVVESVTANGSGVTAQFEVTPHIRTGATAGAAVALARPSAIMRIVPGSYDAPSAGPLHSTVRFNAIQVI